MGSINPPGAIRSGVGGTQVSGDGGGGGGRIDPAPSWLAVRRMAWRCNKTSR